jgi:hypothetical protein
MKKMVALALGLLGSQQSLAQNKWIEAPSTAQPPPQSSAANNGEWTLNTAGQHRFSGNLRVTAATQQGEETFGVACEYDKQKSIIFALGYSINPNPSAIAFDWAFKLNNAAAIT